MIHLRRGGSTSGTCESYIIFNFHKRYIPTDRVGGSSRVVKEVKWRADARGVEEREEDKAAAFVGAVASDDTPMSGCCLGAFLGGAEAGGSRHTSNVASMSRRSLPVSQSTARPCCKPNLRGA